MALIRSRGFVGQVPRRISSVATLAQHLGSVKDVQGLLRHKKPNLAPEVYMQEIPETVRRTVNSIHKELRKRRPRVGRKPRIACPARTDQTPR